ncbi:hypothetical protein Tco_0611830 [Tanacetum coccineum]
MSALRSVESRCKGGDEVVSGMGESGGIPDGRVPNGNGGGAKGSVGDTGSGDDTSSGDSIEGCGGEGI